MRDDIISKDNITHLTDLKVPGLVASAYEKGLDGKLLFEHKRNIRHHMPAREDIRITTREMITRIYLHIYIAYIMHYHCKTRQTSGRGDCGGIVMMAVTSCNAIESESDIA